MRTSELVEILAKYSVVVSERQADLLLMLMEETLRVNETMNLTAIKDQEEFLDKMIIDSAIVFKPGDLDQKHVLDVGSGAGFPGLVIAILYPDTFVTCLDSTRKKCKHIEEVAFILGLNNVKVVNARAEVYAKKQREQYDMVISRAVASLDVLVELCGAFVKTEGFFVAMKSLKADEELDNASSAIRTMGLKKLKVEETTLPLSNCKRYNIWFYKKKSCLKKYPREYKEIKANPL